MPLDVAGTTQEALYLSFNQDASCFSVGTNTGFRLYFSEEFGKMKIERTFRGGIGIVEMLHRSNILALVGGGSSPAFPQTKVIIWDDCSGIKAELELPDTVRAVKLRRDKIIVATSCKVYLYDFETYDVIAKFDTALNAGGILAISLAAAEAVMAIPSVEAGKVRVVCLDQLDEKVIDAHTTALACVALNTNGSLLATASEKGTLIRIFDLRSATPALLKELRRGALMATIYSIGFSGCSRFICVASSWGTLHVFDTSAAPEPPRQGPFLDEKSSAELTPKNQKSTLGILSYVSGYFASEWSFASFRGPELPSIAAFLPTFPASVVVLGADCTYRKLALDTHKGTLDVRDFQHFSEGGDSGSDGSGAA
eukprot:RCo007369